MQKSFRPALLSALTGAAILWVLLLATWDTGPKLLLFVGTLGSSILAVQATRLCFANEPVSGSMRIWLNIGVALTVTASFFPFRASQLGRDILSFSVVAQTVEHLRGHIYSNGDMIFAGLLFSAFVNGPLALLVSYAPSGNKRSATWIYVAAAATFVITMLSVYSLLVLRLPTGDERSAISLPGHVTLPLDAVLTCASLFVLFSALLGLSSRRCKTQDGSLLTLMILPVATACVAWASLAYTHHTSKSMAFHPTIATVGSFLILIACVGWWRALRAR